jgi:enamine deaminase RidA (YjgF/YER057c/UK114 family)
VTVVLRQHNPPELFPPYANYTHAVEVAAGSRLLFISGLNGFEADGETMPPSFEAQAELIWSHLEKVLASAEMTVEDLVSLRFYLAEPAHDPDNVAVLKHRLGHHHAARTVVCVGLLEPGWLIEIEAVAAATPRSRRPAGPA